MGDLSLHFSRSEFADKETGDCKVNPLLVEALEQMRALVGRPIGINSGYRSPAHNIAVGGVGHSQHCVGDAADIEVPGLDTFRLYVLAEQISEFQNGGVGIYPGEKFIHVDVRGHRARWARVKGLYVSIADGLKEV